MNLKLSILWPPYMVQAMVVVPVVERDMVVLRLGAMVVVEEEVQVVVVDMLM